MPIFEDITGKKYGMLTAISISHKVKAKNKNVIYWWWQCDCGIKKQMVAGNIKNGTVKSCGCYNKKHNYTQSIHSMTKTKEYRAWRGMLKRTSGKEKRYSQYVEKGIHKDWLYSFQSFYEHVGDSPSKEHTIDRINNDIGYYPGNVRWATRKEQNRNYSQNKMIEYRGEIKSVTEWCEILNIKRYLVYHRLADNWTGEEALIGKKLRS